MEMALIRESTWRAAKPLENAAVDSDMRDRALAAICLSLEEHNFSLVKNADTAKDAWDKLMTIKMECCESVEDYVSVGDYSK